MAYEEDEVMVHDEDHPVTKKLVRGDAPVSGRLEYLVYLIFGILEILLGFRLILKFLGANSFNNLVSTIYVWTEPFIWPFEGIFSRGFNEGVETTSVFEPSTLVAIIVYALLAWAIVGLIRLFSNRRDI